MRRCVESKFNWAVRPFIGAGILEFGMSRTQVRVLLGRDFVSFKKTADAVTETDAYSDLGLHLYYDSDDRLEVMEFWGSNEIEIKGVPLLNGATQDVLSSLKAAGVTCQFDDGYICNGGSFALSEEDGVINAVTLYKSGYLDVVES
jgi:hypothetical protein